MRARDRVDALLASGQRALALAVGRFVLVLVVGLALVAALDATVGLPAGSWLVVLLVAAGYGVAGYLKGSRLEES